MRRFPACWEEAITLLISHPAQTIISGSTTNETLTALGRRLDAFERIGSWRGAALAEQLRRTSGLSTREVEVAELAMTGLRPSEIGQRLGLTRGTIRTHLERIHEKTGLERRDLVEAARRDLIARDRFRN